MDSKNDNQGKVYLALGDSMSIDHYTEIKGGGAVSQLHRKLGNSWVLNDHTFDSCTMEKVPITEKGDLITLTICGNDALISLDDIILNGIETLVIKHLNLLKIIRRLNPNACFIVGNIYSSQKQLSSDVYQLLIELNEGIKKNIDIVDGYLADIFATFKGNEQKYLCYNIEPNLQGATVIARLFEEQYNNWINNK